MIPLRRRLTCTEKLAVTLLSAAVGCTGAHPHLAPIDDDRIRIEVNAALGKDDRIDAERISVESSGGVVILAGVVRSIDAARRALRHAGRVPGVQKVVNRLRVLSSGALVPTGSSTRLL